jgi:hypothetical protein
MNRYNFFKTLTVHLISLSLTFAPLPLLGANPTEGTVDVNNSDWVGNIGGILGQVSNTVMQSKQQEMAMRQQASLLQGSRPQVVPAKFFPQCRIAPAGAKVPLSACKPSGNPMQSVQNAQTFQTIAQQNIDFYDQLLDEAQNSSTPSGIACLKQAMDGVGSSIQDRINGLERMKEQIAKSNQIFEEQNKKILEDIKRNGNVLLGAGRGKKLDVNQETAEFDKLVSPECKDIIVNSGSATMNSQIFQNGLLGIRDGALSGLNVKASNLQSNYGAYKKDLDSKVAQIKKDIKDYGVEGFLSQNQNGTSFEKNGEEKFGSLTTAFNDKARRLQTKISSIKGSISSELGGLSSDLGSLMNMDQNFQNDFAKFANAAEEQLKKADIGSCVSGAQSGVSLSTDQILAALRYKTTALTGNTLSNYRTALKYILDDTETGHTTKEKRIKDLDAKFGNKVIIVNAGEGSNEQTLSPYQMFQQIVANCEEVFSQRTDSNNGRSTKDKIKRAKTYMRDLQQIERTFASEISNHILDEVMNCSGRTLKAGECSKDSMTTSSPGFCLAQASTCASQANACYKQINKEVKQRQANMNNLATTYNNNIAALITSQEALLGQVKAQVQRDAEFFKSFFPGANYAYPEGLFVKMPQLSEFGGLGVELRGGGDIEVLKNLPGEITKLQAALKGQWEGGPGGKGMAKVIDEYISGQATAMTNNKKKWADLRSECQNTEIQSVAAINKANKEAQDAYGEKAAEVGSFCARFDALKGTNPAAGCNDDYDVAGLYKDSMKVSAHVNDDAIRLVRRYQEICAQSQNEREHGSEVLGDSADGREYILGGCEENGSEATLETAIKDIKELGGLTDEEADQIADATSDDSDEIKEMLEDYKESNPTLASAIRRYIALKEVDTAQRELIVAYQGERTIPTKAGLAPSEKTSIDTLVRSFLNTNFEDKGFCSKSKLDAIIQKTAVADTSAALDTAFDTIKSSDEFTNSRKMENVGRSIASLVSDPEGGGVSDLGQASYAHVQCAAAASPGRFGAGDMFSDFDRGILGPNAGSILGFGK